jgi:hypothetical protein
MEKVVVRFYPQEAQRLLDFLQGGEPLSAHDRTETAHKLRYQILQAKIREQQKAEAR